MKRRTVVAGAFAVCTSLTGCLGSSQSDADETTDKPTTDDPSTTATTPTVNETPHAVVGQWNLPKNPFPAGEPPRVALLTDDDWGSRLREPVLSERSRSFLAATDFAENAVVAVSARVSAGKNRLVVESVEGVGTETLRLRIGEYEAGSGLNNAPLHLLLVRVPNRGTTPTRARATFALVGDAETVTTGE
ncbi:hypothetical protein [Halorussus caseinilyticus]|uniref:hypothetical protein n=1 Tax=Halorussus caseinilyticus TaxID=3034025 RepID=UPI0023E882AD|nr:hypothetical protein [Halorussus sp. DT72]